MEPATNAVHLHRRATVFKLAGYLGEVGLRIDPDRILRDMAAMEGISALPRSAHARSEVWELLGELQQVVDSRKGAAVDSAAARESNEA